MLGSLIWWGIADAATVIEQKNEWQTKCHVGGVTCPTFSVGHVSLRLKETVKFYIKINFYVKSSLKMKKTSKIE